MINAIDDGTLNFLSADALRVRGINGMADPQEHRNFVWSHTAHTTERTPRIQYLSSHPFDINTNMVRKS